MVINSNVNYDYLKIKNYKYWTLFLHGNQCYLGRTYLLAKNENHQDFFDITIEEREEFFEIAHYLNLALEGLFHPDKMNYAALGNIFPRLHIHFIPRYSDKRIFENIIFQDKRWEKNYSPYDYNFKLDVESLIKINNAIRNKLQ